ncbi:MAG: hypothetical protein KAI83_00730 [Thiomargarita sp.]|nr:hypothetical protein [Thiomargarita sp.]
MPLLRAQGNHKGLPLHQNIFVSRNKNTVVGAILYGCPVVGAILYGCPVVGAILYGCPVVGAILYGCLSSYNSHYVSSISIIPPSRFV